MSTQRHIIKRQVIELTMQGIEQPARLQNEISRIYRQRIVPLIDECLTELGDHDRVYRIESLELDIGRLEMQHLEVDLVEKVNLALRHELVAQIDAQERETQNSKQDVRAKSQLELFDVFVRSGSLPWWVDKSRPNLLAENLKNLLSDSPSELRELVTTRARQPRSRQRLVNQYRDDQLLELSGLLIPALQRDLSRQYPILVHILQGSSAASGRQATQINRMLWRHILQVASLGGSEYADIRGFYRAVFTRLAAELGVKVPALIAAMQQVLAKGKVPSGDSSRTAIQQVYQALQSIADELSLPLTGSIQSGRSVRETGAGQGPGKSGTTLPESASATLQQKSRLQEKKPIEKIDQADDLDGLPDELYIENAGLVILWPFLGNFFTHLNLLEKKQFKDHAAQQRAVGLLQALATLEPNPPEFMLPLNKILCGLEVTDVFDFGFPLLDTEAEECERLLQAMIAQAPILGEMTTTGLRGTFVLRAGMLSVRDGFWLLRVERETYDIVLERFPWSWEWVKLPWMDAPLRVEW